MPLAVITLQDLRPALLAGTKARLIRQAFGPASMKSDAWVARIELGGKKIFLRGFENYDNANRLGSRGVTKTFFLSDGEYEVSEPKAFWVVDRYRIVVKEGKIIR